MTKQSNCKQYEYEYQIVCKVLCFFSTVVWKLTNLCGGFRCSAFGRQLFLWQRTSWSLPERPVGGGVRLSLVRPRCQRDLPAAGPGVREKKHTWCDSMLTCHTLFLPCWFSFCYFFHRDIGTVAKHSQFGSGSGLFHYERLGCRGDENSLSKCRSRMFVTGDCNHGNEATVVCAPPEGQYVSEWAICQNFR